MFLTFAACLASVARGQPGSCAGAPPPPPSQRCGDLAPSLPCTVTIDRRAPTTPEIIRVRDAVGVTIIVEGKSPFEACQLNQERTAIEPEQSPLEKFLTSLAGAGVPFVFGALRARESSTNLSRDPRATAAKPALRTYTRMLERLRVATDAAVGPLLERQQAYEKLSVQIANLRSCPGGPLDKCEPCRSEPVKAAYFEIQRDAIVKLLQSFTSPNNPEPSAQPLQHLLDEITYSIPVP
jgi:hypothetical protein